MCFGDATDSPQDASCTSTADIKCSKRTEDQCVTHRESDFYKCNWHKHDTTDVLDKHGTGCYDRDMCMFNASKVDCEINHKCMWKESAQRCVEKAYCPSTCTTTTTQGKCTQNPFCRWTGTECKINNVLDTKELKEFVLEIIRTLSEFKKIFQGSSQTRDKGTYYITVSYRIMIPNRFHEHHIPISDTSFNH